MKAGPPAPRPCISCPYKKDTPSGVWSESEYEKLPLYDEETFAQPMEVFLCHQQDGKICAGWLGCHNQNPPGHELLSLRILFLKMTPEKAEETCNYKSPVTLWSSGAEACEFGLRDIDDPSEAAQVLMQKISRRLEEVWDAKDPFASGDAEGVSG